MAGHSKWKNIRIRKGKQDAIRGKVFTKLSREIIVAAKMGGADPETNARLRVAIEKAKEAAVPKDNIERAIAKGSGALDSENYEEILYEGVGPGGVAVLIEVYSDNRNRTVGDLRHALTKHGGSMTESGSVSWQFKSCGQILVKKTGADEDELTLAAIDGGAEDVLTEDEEYFTIHTPVTELHACNDALVKAGYVTEEVQLTRIATNHANPTEADLVKLAKLLDHLDDLDDVKETYINVEIPESVYESL